MLIREVEDVDRPSIEGLLNRHGMPEIGSKESWDVAWVRNPFLADAKVGRGWVLEESGRVVGYLGNIALRYHFQKRQLVAAAGRGLAVDAEYRNHSLRLSSAFFKQPGVDLLLTTTVNDAAVSVFQLYKFRRIPQQHYDQALFWILEPTGFASALLRRSGWGSSMAALGARVIAPGIRLESLVRSRRPVAPLSGRWQLETIEAGTIDGDFDDLWQRVLRQRPDRVLADRSAEALRWHFSRNVPTERRAKIICARESGSLVGYTVLIPQHVAGFDLQRTRIADLIADDDNPELIDVLLHGAFQQARRDGSHVLELVGFPALVRERFAAGNAYQRQLPSWPFWYRAHSETLAGSLQAESAWYGSLYDGDSSL